MMKKEKKKQEYHKPQIGKIIETICEKYGLENDGVRMFVIEQFPQLLNEKKCANCGASMAEYVFTLDNLDALLLLGMGRIVGKRAKTMSFTDANRVHIQKELNNYYSVASRTTQCAKLGLVAKVLHKNGTHNRAAGWCITKRGFEFLAGKPVPKQVQSFRNKITERFDVTITIKDIVSGNMRDESVRKELSTHAALPFVDLETWAIGGFNQGTLL